MNWLRGVGLSLGIDNFALAHYDWAQLKFLQILTPIQKGWSSMFTLHIAVLNESAAARSGCLCARSECAWRRCDVGQQIRANYLINSLPKSSPVPAYGSAGDAYYLLDCRPPNRSRRGSFVGPGIHFPARNRTFFVLLLHSPLTALAVPWPLSTHLYLDNALFTRTCGVHTLITEEPGRTTDPQITGIHRRRRRRRSAPLCLCSIHGTLVPVQLDASKL